LTRRTFTARRAYTPATLADVEELLTIDLSEKAIDRRRKLGELLVSGQSCPAPMARLTVTTYDHDFARFRKEEPHHADAVSQIPLGFFPQRRLVLVLTRDLGREHRGDVAQLSDGRPDFGLAPDGGVGGPDVASEHHPRFVSAHDEVTMGFRPRSENVNEVHRDVLLNVRARRHVQKPPIHPFEPTLGVRPRRKLFRAKALGTKLDREADARAPKHDGVVVDEPNRGLGHFQQA